MEPRKTSLYDTHVAAGAKMVDFAGYWMPVQYRGVIEEHHQVRKSVGIFDVSHMGEFFIHGDKGAEFLQKVTINDISKLVPGRAQYTAMCYPDGGLIDDLIVYCFEDHFMMIVNAANRKKDYDWLQENLMPGVEVRDRSDEFSLFAVQGRNAEATLKKLTDIALPEIKFYWFGQGEVAGVNAFVARTGYTGEDGFEVAVPEEHSEGVWKAILDAGEEFGIQPIGLAARDTLRLEVKFCLYGNDIDETTNPIEAGLGWITKVDKGDFIAGDVLRRAKQEGVERKLVGFEMQDRAVPRKGYPIVKDGKEIGHVTSGTFSPSLEKGIGVGYVELPHNEVGTAIAVSVRGKEAAAEVVKTPFYQKPY